MKILLTGVTGYIGKRLLPHLMEQGHEVVCAVRDEARFKVPLAYQNRVEVVECDLGDFHSLKALPKDIDGAYYLVHSMSTTKDYADLEFKCAENFRLAMDSTAVQHVVYLSGIVNEKELSEHLGSRKKVEDELSKGNYHFTALRAGIIIGSGSASFEIIRDLVEKLPVMITPKWLNTKCQPIAVRDVLSFLAKALLNKACFDQDFDIGGPDVLTYKEMLLGFAKERGLKRSILVVPVMTPRLSSYWLYFVTATSYPLAVALVDSMKIEVVCRDTKLNEILSVQPMGYSDALKKAFSRIELRDIVSSWKDAFIASENQFLVSEFVQVPQFGCFVDQRKMKVENQQLAIDKIWRLGGDNGWYYGDFLWKIRGILDKAVGGVGLRRGRTNVDEVNVGDALDFWRVLYANKEEGRLLLFAEMKLPGEAWLEFKMEGGHLVQTATFRPLGLLGRLYWYAVTPLHAFVFGGMLKALAGGRNA